MASCLSFVPISAEDIGPAFAAFLSQEDSMATNKPTGDGHRNGAVRKRSQVLNPKTDHFTKRDAESGQFMDTKSSDTKFKGVRKEKGKQH